MLAGTVKYIRSPAAALGSMMQLSGEVGSHHSGYPGTSAALASSSRLKTSIAGYLLPFITCVRS
ncbi:MAG: hypothetical protein ACLUI3_08945 [Christensenellales bacterium]